jgi:hypothetical protein
MSAQTYHYTSILDGEELVLEKEIVLQPIDPIIEKKEISEELKEEVKEAVLEEVKETDIIMEIINIIVKNESISSIQLSKEQIDIITTIATKSPTLIKDINNGIVSIIKDGRIDSSDIPHLINLVKDFYTICHKEPEIKISIKELVTVIAPVMKYIIHIILNKNKSDTPELLSCCDKLIDVCMEIIELQSSLKTVGCIMSNFFNCV